MRKKTVSLALALTGLVACFSSLPDKKYYQIQLSTPPASAPFGRSLLVDRVDVDSLYDDFRIVYRVSSFEVNYYAYHFWAEKPSKLLRDSIIHYLEAARIFPKMFTEPTRDNPDWVLRCAIHEIEEVDAASGWFARLSMKIEVTDFKTGAVLALRRFDRQEPISKKDVGQVPAVLSRILSEELGILLAQLKDKKE